MRGRELSPSDFYRIDDLLTDEERELRDRVRTFCDKEVTPIINDYWERAEFPFELVPKLAALNLAGGSIQGYGAPGYAASVMTGKTAKRAVWQAEITLDGVRVPAANRLAHANGFGDTARVLTATRYGVAWEAVGQALAAYEAALRHPVADRRPPDHRRERIQQPLSNGTRRQELPFRDRTGSQR